MASPPAPISTRLTPNLRADRGQLRGGLRIGGLRGGLRLSANPPYRKPWRVVGYAWRLTHPAFLLIIFGCSTLETPRENRPYESLDAIVSEVKLHEQADVYRLPYPTDPEGQNLFRSAISRLDNWSRVHPGEAESVVAYSRGLCFEKLGDLSQAAQEYGRVDRTHTDLRELAGKRSNAMLELENFFRPPLQSRSSADEAIKRFKDTEFESVAMLSAENQALSEILEIKKRSSSGDYKSAIEELIKRFEDSKRIYKHWLRLGRYYQSTAEEWADRAEYSGFTGGGQLAEKALEKATSIYIRVSQADGYNEKRVAQDRLGTLEELGRRIDRLK